MRLTCQPWLSSKSLPIIASFIVTLAHFLTLYRLRVKINVWQMLGAMIAAMSVQWTVCRAVAQGLITEHLAFNRTSKGGLTMMPTLNLAARDPECDLDYVAAGARACEASIALCNCIAFGSKNSALVVKVNR